LNEQEAIDFVIRSLYGIDWQASLCIWQDGKCAPLQPAGWKPDLFTVPAPKFEIRAADFQNEFNLMHTPIEQSLANPRLRAQIATIFKNHGVSLESLHPYPPELLPFPKR